MQRYSNAFLVVFLILLCATLTACASWGDLSSEDKVLICEGAIEVLVEPECVRFEALDQKYVDLCFDVMGDAKLACDAGINKDPSVMCAALNSKADLCADLVPGDDPLNVATCERVIRAMSLACTIGTAKKSEPEPAPVSADESARFHDAVSGTVVASESSGVWF